MEVDSLKTMVNMGASSASYAKSPQVSTVTVKADAPVKDAAVEKHSQSSRPGELNLVSQSPEKNSVENVSEAAKESDDAISKEYFSKIIKEANEKIFITNREFDYKIHEATNRVVVKVLDKTTKEVVKELPPEKNLDAIAKMLELVGVIIDEKI